MTILDKLKKTVKKDDSTKDIEVQKKNQSKVDQPKTEKKAIAKAADFVYYNILKAPYITEKTAMMGQENKYVFKVLDAVNKIDVRNTVESIYDVTVINVAIINTASKKVRLGAHQGRKPGFKKAIVTLKDGDKIDIGV